MHKYGQRLFESFLDVLIIWFVYSDMLCFTRSFLSTPLHFYCKQLYMYMYLLFLLTLTHISYQNNVMFTSLSLYYCLHIKYLSLLLLIYVIFMLSTKFLHKMSRIKLHLNGFDSVEVRKSA